MIIVKIGKNENINKALKRFKVKVRNSKTMEEYRSRKEFVKKSWDLFVKIQTSDGFHLSLSMVPLNPSLPLTL